MTPPPRAAPGLLHKYRGRALLIAAGSCAVHCRYCFRRHYPYGEDPRTLDQWEPALRHVAGDPSIREVLLSGGDPLMLTDRRLDELAGRIAAVPHVSRLRVHTRLPVVLPDRVTNGLLDVLRGTRLTPLVVVHANHPAEVAGDCAAAVRRLVTAGVMVLNQSVLLAGVNDDVDTLCELSERLADLGAIPLLPARPGPRDRHGPLRGAGSGRVGRSSTPCTPACPATPCPGSSGREPGAVGKTEIRGG